MSVKKEEPSWYKSRGYPHFDLPLGCRRAVDLVSDPDRVTSHAFFPFLHFTMVDRRYKPAKRKVVPKKREIYYAAHADAHIFAYYAHLLNQRYEVALERRAIGEMVLAYRQLGDGRCNIQFAGEAFGIIAEMGNCDAIALDVEGFFDTLNHQRVKKLWCTVLGLDTLPRDHYAVFKAITRFAWAARDGVYRQLNIGRRKAEKLHGRLCASTEFREQIRGGGLISRHDKGKGIPQGSPISAVLSNIYMLDADTSLVRDLRAIGAVYRRYSDDILVICPAGHAAEATRLVISALDGVDLNLSEGKTQTSSFRLDDDGQQRADHPLQYLGFTFDGERILIRDSTLSRYHQRLRAAVRSLRRAVRKARKTDCESPMRKRKIYEQMTHLGRRNFPSYARRSAEVLSEDAIRKQIRGHWSLIQRLLRGDGRS